MSDYSESDNLNNIAIISMVGRFPGANNVQEYWENIRNGVESISFFSNEEAELIDSERDLLNHPNYVKANGVLADVELFDANFFGYSPREAEILDPQARLFLECAWEVLESAGYDSENYDGRISIYAGASVNTYFLFNLFSNPDLVKSVGLEQLKFSNQQDLLTTRVAYKLNLQGSGITIQTACSTSLVAVHLACQSLLCGECDMALAGGVSVTLPQKAGYLYQEGGIASPDGHCRAFDAQAQGTVRGNGIGIVVLKRLADALRDGDRIHAIIKGSAVNNDGALKVGYTAPSIDGQAKVIAEAQAVAGIEPETISYVEAHGTGTALGDPIEIAALTQAFQSKTEKHRFCAIGSVKTNFGHLNAAAGMAGFIKTVLALQHQEIPPSLHFEQPNPQIDFAHSPFYVNTQLTPWQTNHYPRRAGVSSFGIGGTNAHLIVEEAPIVEAATSASRPWQVLLLSAKTASALETATANLANYLECHPDVNLADVAYTLQIGRRRFPHRRTLVCQNLDDAVQTLKSDQQRLLTSYQEIGDRSVTFMFPGQGAQYTNMGQELYENEPIFKQQVDDCCEILKPHLELDLREILYPSSTQAQLQQTALTQPALFVIEYALAKLWMAWGIQPQAMIGNSIGEYVAATLAGVFSLAEALVLVATRGKLMQQLEPGAMLSVSLSAQEVEPWLSAELSLAASNAPSLCVVSGSITAVAALENRLTAQGVDCRRLHTSHAFHSQMMDEIVAPLTQQIQKIKLNSPQIPFISNVTGTWITATEATDPHYWAKHLRQTVRFSEGMTELLQQPERVLLEVGPGRTLSTLVKRHQAPQAVVLTSLRHPQEQLADIEFILNTVSRLWLAGVQIDWTGFYKDEQRQRIPLPTYPFERQRYWIEPQAKVANLHQLGKKSDIADWFYLPSWKRSFLPSKSAAKSRWLVFLDTFGVSEPVVAQLEAEEVITVTVGEQFTQLGNNAYAINPKVPDDYDRLFTQLRNQEKIPQAIAHFWSLIPQECDRSTPEFFATCQDYGFYSLLFLVQALGKQETTQQLQIIVVTNSTHEVNGDELLCPEKATVLGLCKVIPQEYPQITCRQIDITGTNQLTPQLLAELTSLSPDLVVAYRSSHRWVETFESFKLEATTETKTRLRQKGVYLITGGLGGIGKVLAEHLAETLQAKLILISRSPLPQKTAWATWLAAHDAADPTSSKIQQVQALEALGAEVLVITADVTSLTQMQRAISLGLEQFGEINGVIHAAGVKAVNTVQEISREECQQQFAPKIQGLYVLEQLLQTISVDFCILISSLASVLGLLGKAAYPAAHIFLDVFACDRNRTSSTPWISINWDSWLTEPATTTEGLTPQEAIAAWRRILSLQGVSQVIVSTVDLQARLNQWTTQVATKKVDLLSLHTRPNLSSAYAAPTNQIEQIMVEIWQQLLGVAVVGIYDNFFELGGDSVLGIQLIARANQAGLKLATKQVFEHQTIAELAAVASTHQNNQAEQGCVTGLVPLSPIQQWFWTQNQPEAHHWNQSITLEVSQGLDVSFLKETLQHLLAHHDALRLRFMAGESGWQQVNAPVDETVPLTCLDLSELSAEQQNLAMEKASAQLQASLNLSFGPIVRVGLFNLGAKVTSRLLIVIHHLAVDVTSWRIFLEDLHTVYQQLSQGLGVKLPPKTTSFQQWTTQLQQQKFNSDLDYWLEQLSHPVTRLPRDYAQGVNTVASAQIITVTLDAEPLQQVSSTYRLQIEEVLLAGLLQAFAQWTGDRSLLLDLEGNGRDVLLEDVDLSRTVGWFTTIAPLLLKLDQAENPGDILQTVKEQVRRLPDQGLSYGVLRYLSVEGSKLQSFPQPEVIFLYLGQLADSVPESSLFRLLLDSKQIERSPQGIRPHLFQITAFVSGGQMQVKWTYSENLHQRTTIEVLAQNFVKAIQQFITHCQSPKAVSYTPSDFSAAKLSQTDLSKLLTQISLSDRRKSQ
ncbi:SDR family NAD(P)-dependent oxidoreductase [Nostocaceae cyanobacterium CENA357]|uniref:Phenolphthiocerol/phthiocerol polyketide synthase subunit E n=1 Tax=Atlanticothrix silvestris CENA357 TaxID=1725252 RepID=A0A8J7HKC7_9CYAN|nr:type I polyketide synthase [Atlanticothrix silvestris]MBH8554253.1 SDR family NAD(P)-dependent oxidoreductase [Atlanticothrix silvestris CENA357]